MEDRLSALFAARFGAKPEEVTLLPGSGSHRKYYRLCAPGVQVVGVSGTDPDENRAFIHIAGKLREAGVNVPEVYASEGLCYLQEDLGDTILFDVACRDHRYTAPQRELLLKTVSCLPRIQFEGARSLDWGLCYPQAAFDGRMVDFDLNYFKYCFLRLAAVSFHESQLQDDFDRLKEDLLSEPSETFMYRDFQSRNVMVRGGEPWFIDFQGGRKGPIQYDVASFLWQARAAYPDDLREEMIRAYLTTLKPYSDVSETHFRERLRLFVLFRSLQVLGAYGLRGLHEGKQHFVDSIPGALENLRSLLPLPRYPYLSELLGSLAVNSFPAGADRVRGACPPPDKYRGRGPLETSSRVAGTQETVGGAGVKLSETESPRTLSAPGGKELTVTIYSFSYKKGIPEDASGNGGGYVFDCRSVHNPGKYEAYKQLTGLDEPVIRFLEEDGEILRFLEHVYALVDAHVERFLSRGFTHLQVSFGCTGGQHRSAYSAEHLAAHLQEKYGSRVKPVVIHRELVNGKPRKP